MKSITEGELWEIVETGRKNVNNIIIMDGIMDCESTEYSSHALADVMDGKPGMTGSWSQYLGLPIEILTR